VGCFVLCIKIQELRTEATFSATVLAQCLAMAPVNQLAFHCIY